MYSVVGITLHLEIHVCEGNEAELKKKWSHLPAGTAQTLRLISELWHATGQILVANSAVSSVAITREFKCHYSLLEL